jgi:hypothetical protein
MTDEAWKLMTELFEILKERFDDQENSIKNLEKQLELLTEDKKWTPEHRQVREAE